MRGFTFVELLVVLAISALLTAAGLAAYRGFGEREALKQAGASLETDLKLVHRRALAGEKPDECSGNLVGFSVTAGSDTTNYQVLASCSITDSDPIIHTLPEGVEFQTPITGSIDFLVLSSTVAGAQNITLTTESGSASYRVTIESSGVIRGNLL